MRRTRGYALLFVIMMAVALGILVAGLFSALSESVSTSRASHEELQQLYGCDGALRLAFDIAERHRGSTDLAALRAELDALAAALPRDINPRTGRPFADIADIRVDPATAATFTSMVDPFTGMEYTQEGSEITVVANLAGRGRLCRADSPNRMRTMSYFQFAAVSCDVVNGALSVDATGGTTGDVYVLQHPAESRKRLPSPRHIVAPRGPFSVHDIQLSQQDSFRPTPPAGMPWSFIRKTSNLFGTKRSTRHKRPTLEYFLKYPTDTPTLDAESSRFFKQADLRIVDGDWFIPGGASPGRLIYSDRRSNPAHGAPRSFSSYERNGDNRAIGGGAAVRYGLVHANNASPAVRGFCSDVDEFGRVTATPSGAVPAVVACSSSYVAPVSGELDPYFAASMRGFVDPANNTPILPIVVDVAALAAAMLAPAPNDLGSFRCLGPSAAVCPDDRRFRGSLWVGTRETAALPTTALPQTPCAVRDSGVCTRPNAVILYNARDLSPFLAPGEAGLSIASNLPMYVVGDVNATVTDDARVALLAPQITALSPTFDMTKWAWGVGGPTPSASATLTWNASLFTSWASDDRLQRNPAQHVLRQIEGGVSVNITGSVVAMFTRGQYNSINNFNKKKGGYEGKGGSYSARPDPQVAGLPVFPSTVAGELSRRAGGTLRYPGDGNRDLRFAARNRQPPASPRLSIDPAPVDRR